MSDEPNPSICAPGATRLPDDQIAAEALTRLAWDAWVPRDALEVTVDHGWVTLAGQLERAEQKAAALEDVTRLFGVAGVSDRTTIKRGGERPKGPKALKRVKCGKGGKPKTHRP